MPLSSPALRRFVKQTLISSTRVTAPDNAQLARAFDALCDSLRIQLHPLFGPIAIAALFARALHVATGEFAWLADVMPRDAQRCSLEGLDLSGDAVEADTLADGLAAVLAHDIGLLNAFIGYDLVMPLVQTAWSVTAPIADPEPKVTYE